MQSGIAYAMTIANLTLNTGGEKMRILIILAALLVPSVCMAQKGQFEPFRVQILGAGHPSSPFYGRAYTPSYGPVWGYYRHMPYCGGYMPSGGGSDFYRMRQTWALEDIAGALQSARSHALIYGK
jgi:hypothetical protein